MGRIGVYGGSFNPPHLGHVLAAQEVKKAMDLDAVYMIPAAVPPHKELSGSAPSARSRLAMLRLAVADMEGVEACDIELRRQGPSYSVDTLLELHRENPRDELFLLMGSDMFLSFTHWRQFETICQLATLVTFARTEQDKAAPQALRQQAELLHRQYGARVQIIENDMVEISSTQVRRLLAFGCGQSVLPEPVHRYILDEGLYGTGGQLQRLDGEALLCTCLDLADARRRGHITGCLETACQLAGRYGENQTLAARAAALHDITKPLSFAHQLLLCKRYGIILSNFEEENHKLIHAKTGAAVAGQVFGESQAVCDAIMWHTTGRADMTRLEKILYLADFIEPTRRFAGVDSIRALARENLDKALLAAFTLSLEFLQHDGKLLDPNSVQARAFLQQQKGF